MRRSGVRAWPRRRTCGRRNSCSFSLRTHASARSQTIPLRRACSGNPQTHVELEQLVKAPLGCPATLPAAPGTAPRRSPAPTSEECNSPVATPSSEVRSRNHGRDDTRQLEEARPRDLVLRLARRLPLCQSATPPSIITPAARGHSRHLAMAPLLTLTDVARRDMTSACFPLDLAAGRGTVLATGTRRSFGALFPDCQTAHTRAAHLGGRLTRSLLLGAQGCHVGGDHRALRLSFLARQTL